MGNELIEAVISGNIKKVKSVIDQIDNINKINRTDSKGNTALHYAIINDFKYIAKLLLESGASECCAKIGCNIISNDTNCSEAM